MSIPMTQAAFDRYMAGFARRIERHASLGHTDAVNRECELRTRFCAQWPEQEEAHRAARWEARQAAFRQPRFFDRMERAAR